jgi:hypothetical protein
MDALAAQVAALAAELQRQRQESTQREAVLQQQLVGLQTQGLNQLANAQTQLLQALGERREHRQTLVDTKGLGKPSSFDGTEEKFLPWKTRTENFVIGVYPDIASALEWAEEQTAPIESIDVVTAFGDANDADYIPELVEKQQQLFMVLQQLCEREAFDLVTNCGRGQGLEAWRKLNRRYDPATGGRKRTLLRHILSPTRVKIDDLSGAIEKWMDSIRMYERRKDEAGRRTIVADDVKISVLESLVPSELERHMQLNRAKFSTFSQAMEEIHAYLERREKVLAAIS